MKDYVITPFESSLKHGSCFISETFFHEYEHFLLRPVMKAPLLSGCRATVEFSLFLFLDIEMRTFWASLKHCCSLMWSGMSDGGYQTRMFADTDTSRQVKRDFIKPVENRSSDEHAGNWRPAVWRRQAARRHRGGVTAGRWRGRKLVEALEEEMTQVNCLD